MSISARSNKDIKFKLAVVFVFLIFSCTQQTKKETEKEEDNGILMATNSRPLTDIKYESTPERIARGKYLVEAVWCVACHTESDTTRAGWPPIMEKRLSGALRYKTDSTHLYAPNLTSDKETGIGNFTDDMIGRAIREGIGHDGRSLVGAGRNGMPVGSFRKMTNEDLASIIVYLRTVPAIKNKVPKRKIGINEEKRSQGKAKPLKSDPAGPDFNDPVSRGKYLISIGDCAGCHRGNIKDTGFLGGGHDFISVKKQIVSPNITSDETGIGNWSSETFIAVMRNGAGKSGQLSHIMPWIAFRNFTDEDLTDMYKALMASDPVKHLVLNNVPPSYCEVCEQNHGMGNFNHIQK